MSGRSRARMILTIGTAYVLVGCALFPDVSSLSSGTDATAADATTQDGGDAGILVNACGALLSGTEVPLADPGFETGCGGWTAYLTNVSEDYADPLTGKIACRVCNAGMGGGLNQLVGINAQVGETYEFVACMRDDPDASAPGPVVTGVATGVSGNYSSAMTLDSTYRPVSVRWTVSPAGPLNVITAFAYSPDGGGCYLVDETSLRKLDGG